ncbi:MAG: hypothetical protein L0229_13430 [Blastocatellia bacterium]|nr:hypothetical protein [Blastocatellia bacterium]
MSQVKILKAAIVGGWVLGSLLWAASSSFSKPAEPVETESLPAVEQQSKAEDYVGSETCKDCHAGQFNSYFKTAHARLEHLASWPADKKGCEACHGPGKAHVEAGGDKSLIKTLRRGFDKDGL